MNDSVTRLINPQWRLEDIFNSLHPPLYESVAFDGNTRFIFLEIISSPQMEVADIREIVDVGNRRWVPVILDKL